MDTNALAKEINDLLAVERRSLLEHFLDAVPHVTPATYRAWNEVKKLAHRDSDHAARLSAILAAMRQPERPTPFSQDVGFYHYMSVEKAIALLIDEKRKHLAAYDRALHHVAREPQVAAELESLRADNLAELLGLEGLQKQIAKKARPAGGASPDLNNAANAAVAAKVLAAAKAKASA